VTAEHVHGKTGLDGPELHEPQMPLQSEHAVDFIIETLMREPPGTVTLCTLGPLTNIALALEKAPQIAGRVQELVMMGGGFFEAATSRQRPSSIFTSIRRRRTRCSVPVCPSS